MADPTLVDRMLAVMSHRGPDGVGSRATEQVQAGACRLAIVDRGARPQPVLGEDQSGPYVVFNGEIYNHRMLRQDLESHGHRFTNGTDTEVIIHLYEEYGAGMCTRLEGMFALAIVDGTRVLLARDRFGIKPLYIATSRRAPGTATFASEVKALLQWESLDSRLNESTLVDFALLGHERGTATFLMDVQTLPPGHRLWLDAAAPEGPVGSATRFAPETSFGDSTDIDAAESQIYSALQAAVASHLEADVPVAMTLSGGVDSSLLALIAAELGSRPDAYTVADSATHPDLRCAEGIARYLGLSHHPVLVEWPDFLASVPQCVAVEERPGSLATIPFLLLCQRIASETPVCLHGEGADELFAGYREHADKPFRLDVLRDRLIRVQRAGLSPSDDTVALMESWLVADPGTGFTEAMRRHGLGDQLERQHLGPVDRGAMSTALEVRVPFLADGVANAACALSTDLLVEPATRIRKYVLRRLTARLGGPALFDATHRVKIGVPSAGSHHVARFDALCERANRLGIRPRGVYDDFFDSARYQVMMDLFVDSFVVRRGERVTAEQIENLLGIDERKSVA